MKDIKIAGRVDSVKNIQITTTYSIQEIYTIIKSEFYQKVEKGRRPLVYASISQTRPTKDSFCDWTGLQIFDLDIHDNNISSLIIEIIHNVLKKFKWYALSTLSTSGNGIHIYTAIDVSSITDMKKRKEIYYNSYYNKVVIIYNLLSKLISEKCLTFKAEDVIDNHMMNVAQGVFIAATKNCYYNEDFELKVFNENTNLNNNILGLKTKITQILQAEDKDTTIDISNIEVGNVPVNIHRPIHYKYQQRWAIINTLVAIFGDTATKSMLPNIFTGTDYSELLQIVRTAKTRHKGVSTIGIDLLNQNHGFNIKYKDGVVIGGDTPTIEDTIKPDFTENKNHYIQLKSDEFLLDKKDELLKIIKDNKANPEAKGNIVILESGTGTGKTHFFANLDAKVLLIEPFISVIESNFDPNEWECVYSNKRPQYQRNIVMTFDKFAKVDLLDLMSKGYEYIVIDESHLLLSSPYRPILGKVIEVLSKLVEWNKELTNPFNIIMMSGTPFGERLFFSKLYDKYIKIEKDTDYVKHVEYNIDTSEGLIITKTVIAAVEQIHSGGTVLMPCNQGEKFVKVIEKAIDWYGSIKYEDWKPIKKITYRKSTGNSKKCTELIETEDASEYDFITCTTYMSVGVNITKFRKAVTPLVIFNNVANDFYSANDIEQFANRLRQTDLNVIVNHKVSEIDDSIFNTLSLSMNSDAIYIEYLNEIIKLANKYQNNDYLKSFEANEILKSADIQYDTVEEKFTVNKEYVLLRSFYEDYSKYIDQLSVIIKMLEYYNYVIDIKYLNQDTQILQDCALLTAQFQELKRVVKGEYSAIYEAYIDYIAEHYLRVKNTISQDLVEEDSELTEIISFSDTGVLYVKNRKEFDYIYNLFHKFSHFFSFETIVYILDNCRDGAGVINWTKVENIYDNIAFVGKEDQTVVNGMHGLIAEHIGMLVETVKDDITPILEEIVDKYLEDVKISFLPESKLRAKYKKLVNNIYKIFFFIDEEDTLQLRNWYREYITLQSEGNNLYNFELPSIF